MPLIEQKKDPEKVTVAHIGRKKSNEEPEVVVHVREGITSETVKEIEKIVEKGCDSDPNYHED